MAQPTRSRQDLRLDVLKKLDPVSEPKSSSCTADGSTTTLTDSKLAPAAQSEDFVGDWIYIRDTPSGGPAIGEIARVTNVDFSGSTSTLTLAPALSLLTKSTQLYERHRKIRPNIINDRLDVILGLLRQNVLLPVTLVADGDMEASGVTDWTAENSTLTKDTTYVRRGRQSLKIVSSSTLTGYAKSASIYLPGGTVCIVEADIYITPGDAVDMFLYDVTNTAVIGTQMESDESGWVHLENTFTVPATCEEVQVWMKPQADTEEVYIDHATVWPVYDKGIELPSFLQFVTDAKSLFYLPVGTGLAGSTNVNAYRINEGAPQLYAHFQKERDDTGVGASRLYVEGRNPTNALWIKGRKPYPAFAGATDAAKDVDTTQANRYVVANMTAASILDDMALDATEAEKPQLAEQLQNKALLLRFEVAPLIDNMTPSKKIISTPFTRE